MRARPRVAAALALTGRDAAMGRQAAAGLTAYASARGAALEIVDHESSPNRAARAALDLATRCDVLLGPYGSGATRAVVEALAELPWVLWNHGGAAVERTGARVVDVLGPAERYWAGLAPALADLGADPGRVAILHGGSPFGRAVADGARRSLAAAGHHPLVVATFAGPGALATALSRVRSARAEVVVGSGRMEEEIVLARALGRDRVVGLVACGVQMAHRELGDLIEGWIGPAQWLEGGRPFPGLPAGAEYPAAQALASCLVAERALALAGTADPAAVWRAARMLRTRTSLGPFAVDDEGRQVAHAPLIVRWRRTPDGLRRQVVWAPQATGGGQRGLRDLSA